MTHMTGECTEASGYPKRLPCKFDTPIRMTHDPLTIGTLEETQASSNFEAPQFGLGHEVIC